ncbi:hypothetical protein PIB30_076642 [Stylosanthes scabra]|uniref:Secreted protein n=1 Tax=Stylosanthes scabra TaxID=79078 RepID=A0ABU6UPR5_9FABA|nr:hypothetical protein [Stylosanthes scabra]
MLIRPHLLIILKRRLSLFSFLYLVVVGVRSSQIQNKAPGRICACFLGFRDGFQVDLKGAQGCAEGSSYLLQRRHGRCIRIKTQMIHLRHKIFRIKLLQRFFTWLAKISSLYNSASHSTLWVPLDLVLENAMNGYQVSTTSAIEVIGV